MGKQSETVLQISIITRYSKWQIIVNNLLNTIPEEQKEKHLWKFLNCAEFIARKELSRRYEFRNSLFSQAVNNCFNNVAYHIVYFTIFLCNFLIGQIVIEMKKMNIRFKLLRHHHLIFNYHEVPPKTFSEFWIPEINLFLRL